MNKEKYLGDLAVKTDIKRVIWFILIGSIICNIFLSMRAGLSEVQVRTILVPPMISQKMTVGDNIVSASYLSDMSQFIVQQIWTTSPQTIEANYARILDNVSPKYRGSLELDLMQKANNIKKNGFDSYFITSAISVDTQNLVVTIDGDSTVLSSTTVVQKKHLTLKLQYENQLGLVHLSAMSIQETAMQAVNIEKEKSPLLLRALNDGAVIASGTEFVPASGVARTAPTQVNNIKPEKE